MASEDPIDLSQVDRCQLPASIIAKLSPEISIMGIESPPTNQTFDEFETRNLAYNIFVLLVTILALFSMLGYYFLPLPPQVKQVLLISDVLAWSFAHV